MPAPALAAAKRRARGRADNGDDSGSDADERGGSAPGVDSDEDAEALMASAAISDKLKDALEGMTEKRCGRCAATAGPGFAARAHSYGTAACLRALVCGRASTREASLASLNQLLTEQNVADEVED